MEQVVPRGAAFYSKHLLPNQGNRLHTLLREAGRLPDSCQWVEAWMNTMPALYWVFDSADTMYAHPVGGAALTVVGTPFYFALGRRAPKPNDYVLGTCPSLRGNEHSSVGAGAFDVVEATFKQWLARLRDEEVPDFWACSLAETLTGSVPGPERLFTSPELQKVHAGLDELKDFIASQSNLTSAKLEALEREIDYLKRAAGRVTKIDWRNILASQVFSMVVASIVPQELAGSVYQAACSLLLPGALPLPPSPRG